MGSANPISKQDGLGKDERRVLVERIAASPQLKTSPRLCEFLLYVADCAIRQAPEEATEQQIGIRIFHRNPGYNCSEDSIVRTHARLLRQKLASYFAEDGLAEPCVVHIPKGHYVPVFHPRFPVASPEQPPLAPIAAVAPKRRFRFAWGMGLLLVAALAGAGWALVHLRTWTAASQSAESRFWKPFFTDDPALVIFSNAMFVGDSKNGLRYARPEDGAADKSGGQYVDTYTGIGELASVYALTRLFDAHGAHFILKRSLLTTWDEARSKDLIFIGSTAENPSLSISQSAMEFTLTAGKDFAGFVNHHPKAGEPAVYARPEHPMTRDYAVIALLPGLQPGKKMLIFSGLTTLGTQAAVDFACRPDSAAELLKQVGAARGAVRPFEALLETSIGGGVPLQTHLVTLRLH
jgi:hypothetical protein